GLAPVEADLSATLDEGSARVRAQVRDTASAAVATLELDVAAPLDPTDIAAWQRLTRADVRLARLQVDELTAATVARWSGESLPVTGELQGTIEFPHEGRAELGVRLDAHSVDYGGYEGFGFELDLGWDARRL